MSVTWLGHATVLFEVGGLRLLTDPVLRGRVAFLSRVGAGAAPATPPAVDVVLLSTCITTTATCRRCGCSEPGRG